MRLGIIAVLLLGASAGAYVLYANSKADKASTFRLEAVERTADLVASISATGSVEPEEVVDIGSQVVGPISKLGQDLDDKTKPIDFDSRVEAGTVLAQIEDSKYKAAVDLAEANLMQAEAGLKAAEANLDKAKADLHQRENDYKRAQNLFKTQSIAEADYDQAVDNYQTAKATVGVCEAAIATAKANIAQTTAALRSAQIDLGYTTVKAPVKGVIIDRRINVGQTVVSTMSSTSVFLLAKDLKRLQVWASVNEADIGQIYVGQPVSFTVDARSGRVFKGAVSQIRLNATMTQNVVTYTVVVTTDNSDGALLPYLTANLKFETARRSNVLTVPSVAVRWTPRPNQIVADARAAAAQKRSHGKNADDSQGTEDGKNSDAAKNAADSKNTDAGKSAGKNANGGKPNAADPASAAKPAADAEKTRGRVWIDDNGFARPIRVKVGIGDGLRTEVSGRDLKEGMEVITGESRGETASSDVTNPFAPKLPFGKKK